MSSISIPTPNSVPRDVIALAGIFFVVTIALVVAIGLLAFSNVLLWYLAVVGVLMAIWFGSVVYYVWRTDESDE